MNVNYADCSKCKNRVPESVLLEARDGTHAPVHREDFRMTRIMEEDRGGESRGIAHTLEVIVTIAKHIEVTLTPSPPDRHIVL